MATRPPNSRDYTYIHPEFATILEKEGMPKPLLPEPSQIQKYRHLYRKGTARTLVSPFMQKHLGKARQYRPWNETDRQIDAGENASISVRVYQPQVIPKSGIPALLVVHGGGWCMGDLDTEAFLCGYLCAMLNLVVVSVGYRLYPDVPFPVPIHDVYHAMKWTQSNAAELQINLSQGYAALGVSGGGNHLNSAIYLAAEDTTSSAPKLSGYALLCTGMPHHAYNPVSGERMEIFGPEVCPSWEALSWAPLMSRETNEKFLAVANPPLDSRWWTPFLQPYHENLPPRLYYQIAGLDPWQDTAYLYKKIMKDATSNQSSAPGVEVRTDFYPGLPHCWWTVWPQISESEKWLQDLTKGVAWLFDIQETPEDLHSQRNHNVSLKL